MCGIAGVAAGSEAPPPTREECGRMARAMSHRGPDGNGVLVDGRLGFSHARLAVIDRAGGHQPMTNPARGTTIVYNGEVFNHVELRRELERDGLGFRTQSDTEVVLAAYERWGDAAWERLEGQFALAVFDRKSRNLHLVRDRAGICPLFVARQANSLVFASEVKALFASGRVDPRVDLAGINAVFRNWSSPGSTTVFDGVETIEPGLCVTIAVDGIGSRAWRLARQCSLRNGSGVAVCRTYARFRAAEGDEDASGGTCDFSAVDSSALHVPRPDFARGETREERVATRLRSAVRRRLRADIPVGAYLSGGLDSSLLVALMVEERARVGAAPPTTFSLRFRNSARGTEANSRIGSDGDDLDAGLRKGFDAPFDEGFDEGAAQRIAARALGTDHREIVVGTEHIVETLGRALDHAETPLLRAGPLPMLLLSQFVRDQGLRVVLTGEGADEVFAGYDIFKEARFRSFLARDPTSVMRNALASRLHRQHAGRTKQRGIAMWSAFLGSSGGGERDVDVERRLGFDAHVQHMNEGRASATAFDEPFSSHTLRWQNGAWMLRFLAPEVRAALDQEEFQQRVESSMPRGWRDFDDVGRAQELEIASFMVPYLLSSQGDRMLMANGVEGRYPYLDGALAAEAAMLRSEERLVGLREKPLLRRIARRFLPQEIARRPKWPYRSPMQRAFFGVNAPEFVRDTLSHARLQSNPLIDADAAIRLVHRALSSSAAQPLSEREEMAAFGLLTLVLWHERFIERPPYAPHADLPECVISLSERDACACTEDRVACMENGR